MKYQSGFNLTELLIVIAIVAILAAVALPSYQDSTRKTRRADAKSLLFEVAQLQEKHFTLFGRYGVLENVDDGNSESDAVLPINLLSENGYYQIDLVASTETASTFTVVATPQGGQADDPCGNLTLTHTGVKGHAVGGTNCW